MLEEKDYSQWQMDVLRRTPRDVLKRMPREALKKMTDSFVEEFHERSRLESEPPIQVHGLKGLRYINSFATALELGTVDQVICQILNESISGLKLKRPVTGMTFSLYRYMAIHGSERFFTKHATAEDFAHVLREHLLDMAYLGKGAMKKTKMARHLAESIGYDAALVAFCFGRFTRKRAASDKIILGCLKDDAVIHAAAVKMLATLRKQPPF